jgi:hypothetical protein
MPFLVRHSRRFEAGETCWYLLRRWPLLVAALHGGTGEKPGYFGFVVGN